MGVHGPISSSLYRSNVINATANESIEPRHWMALDAKNPLKTLNFQVVNVDHSEYLSAIN